MRPAEFNHLKKILNNKFWKKLLNKDVQQRGQGRIGDGDGDGVGGGGGSGFI